MLSDAQRNAGDGTECGLRTRRLRSDRSKAGPTAAEERDPKMGSRDDAGEANGFPR